MKECSTPVVYTEHGNNTKHISETHRIHMIRIKAVLIMSCHSPHVSLVTYGNALHELNSPCLP